MRYRSDALRAVSADLGRATQRGGPWRIGCNCPLCQDGGVTGADAPEISPEEASRSGAGQRRDDELPLLAAVWLAQGNDGEELREMAGLTRQEACQAGRGCFLMCWPRWAGHCRTAECPPRARTKDHRDGCAAKHPARLRAGRTRRRDWVHRQPGRPASCGQPPCHQPGCATAITAAHARGCQPMPEDDHQPCG